MNTKQTPWRVSLTAPAAILLALLAPAEQPSRAIDTKLAVTPQGQTSPITKSPTPEQIPPGALVPSGASPMLTVFATGDVIGYLEPCG